MILEFLMNAIKDLIFFVLGFIQIPNFPESFTGAINEILDLIFGNVGLLGLAIRWSTVKVGVPILIAVANMDHIYDGVMWILRKIPMLGIE